MAENQARAIVLDYVSPTISGGHPIRLRDDLTREELERFLTTPEAAPLLVPQALDPEVPIPFMT